MIALRQGLREIPAVVAMFPTFLHSGLWNFVPLLLLLVGFTAELVRRWRSGNQSANRTPSNLPALSSALPRPSPPEIAQVGRVQGKQIPDGDRIYVTETVRDLVEPFKTLTAVAAERQTHVFVGKWMKLIGPISDVTGYGDSVQLFVAFRQKMGSAVFAFLDFSGAEVARVEHLAKETIVEVEGRIEKIGSSGVTLVDCYLIDVRRPDSFPPA